MRVFRFLARRLLYSLVVLLGVLVVVFALVHLVPGDPVRIALGTRYSPEAYQALRSASGLDRPIVEQFVGYVGSALSGNLGVSFRTGEPVMVTLLDRLPATLSLAAAAIVIALLISVPAGTWAALHQGRASDAIVRVATQFGVSIPDFWMGILLIELFATTLRWLPTSGYAPLIRDPTGWLRHVILPGSTVGLVAAAIMTRYIRSAVLDVASMGCCAHSAVERVATQGGDNSAILRNAHPVLTITGISRDDPRWRHRRRGGFRLAGPGPAGLYRSGSQGLLTDPGCGATHRGAVSPHQPDRPRTLFGC